MLLNIMHRNYYKIVICLFLKFLLQYLCNEGQRTACRSQLSASARWFPGIELRSSGLKANQPFAYWAILVTQIVNLNAKQNL